MRAGRLRHLVQLLEPVNPTPTEGGSITPPSWQKRADVWAAIEPIKGTERLAEGKVLADVTHEIRMRRFAGITPAWRVEFKGRRFELLDVRRPDEREIEVVMMAKEVVA